jgi:uncharacterized cofD-like protein
MPLAIQPPPMRRIPALTLQSHPPLDELRVVALGGGTGLPVVLEGLKDALLTGGSSARREYDRDRLTAVVTVADDGGSSGRLRQAYGVLPPGDVRNCLLALAERGNKHAAIFNFRVRRGDPGRGPQHGNIVL